MPSENTYSAFKSNDFIVVLHQQGHDIPQTLAIFREPRNLISHEKKLIGTYSYSNEAITLIDDPQHDGRDVLNAISLHLRKQRNSVATRGLKYLASAVAGALITSAIWYHATPGDLYGNLPEKGATSFSIPTVGSPESWQAPDRKLNQTLATAIAAAPTNPATTNETLRHAAATESQNMQNAMRDNRNALPTSPSAALQPSTPPVPPVASGSAPVAPASPSEALQMAATPVTPPTTVKTEATEQSARQKMVGILKRSADRGLFTIPLSTGHERTLYTFLDPTCAVCKSMEPEIEQLAQHYNVIIFPVSVVNGGGDAVDKIVPVLCEKDLTARAVAWSDLFRPDAGVQVPGQATSPQVSEDCAVSAQAVVAVNNTGFRTFGFSGTPTVLTDTGIRLATGMLTAPDKIAHFLQITDPMSPEQVDRFVSSLSIQE